MRVANPEHRRTTRERILESAWKLIGERSVADVTLADVAAEAGVSRQTLYVHFGTRAGLLTAMVRYRDATNPRRKSIDATLALDDPVEALDAFTRALSSRWPELHPVARALHAGALTDDDARAAWDDRMQVVHERAALLVNRLNVAGLLDPFWTEDTASDWLWSQLNPLNWLSLVEGAGWSQATYEDRLAETVRRVLLRPAPGC